MSKNPLAAIAWRRWLGTPWAPLLVALPLLWLGLWLGGGALLTMDYYAPHGKSAQVVPVPFHHGDQGEFRLEGVYEKRAFGTSRLRVIPDDHLLRCIVNGVEVDLSGYPSEGLQDWAQGFVLKLDEYLQPGANKLVFVLNNSGGPGGLRVHPEPGTYALGRHALPALGVLLLALALARFFRLTRGQQVLLVLATALICVYWSQTPFHTRTYDVLEGGGHLDFIRYVVNEKNLPPPYGGWEYHQPPLYYMLGAAVYAIDGALGLAAWDLSLQLLAIVSFLLMLVSAGASLRLFLGDRPWVLLPVTALLFFWPSGIIHSVRLGNDILLYALCSLSLYFTSVWWLRGCLRAFLWAAFFVAMALLTKTTASACAATLALLWVWRLWRPLPGRRPMPWKISAIAVLLVVLAVVGSLGDNVYLHLTGKTDDWLFANAGHALHPALTVGNGWKNWLVFDVPTFLKNPYMDGWSDSQGRQQFWNYFLRTSLFSQWFFQHPVQRAIAFFAGGWLLVLLGLGLSALVVRRRALVRYAPWLLGAAISLAAVISFRHKLPMSPHGDFRFIQYSVTALALALGMLLRRPMGRVWRGVLTAVVCVLPVGSVVFFLLL